VRPVKRPRLIVADEHALVAAGIRSLLEDEYDVAGIAGDGRALLAMAETLRPDLILLGVSLPLLNGIETARRLRRSLPRTKVIFVTMQADPAYLTEALRAGCCGYVLKRCAPDELFTAIREALKGRSYITPLVARDLSARRKPGRFAATLTERQREVLQLVAEGRSTKEIAAVLHVSTKTVEFHRSSTARKLGLHTTAELTKYAINHGILVG
jgi:DNA-binding NarL/FixJ family response regulator